MQEQYHKFQEIGVEWVAISTDSPESVYEMRQRGGLTFRLLTDTGGKVARRYRCIWSKDGNFNEPALFFINKDGVLLFQALVSTANGLAPVGDVLGHIQWRMETGRI